MSDITSIQWADSTVNPIMGCGGCELFPSPGEVLANIDQAVNDSGTQIQSKEIYKDLVDSFYSKIDKPHAAQKKAVNTTNIWHLREHFLKKVSSSHGKNAAAAAENAIRKSITCYAAILHLNKGYSILKPNYMGHNGYAPIFESVSQFPRRASKVAELKDLYGQSVNRSSWKSGLPRLVFVSDMGDALSTKADFQFLKSDLLPAITSNAGKRHLWLWLSKRPGRMADFAEEIGGLPENVCAMTTLTGTDEMNLQRLAELKNVKSNIRGLSIEPLWERIPPDKLNLEGIHWVIVGGESGAGLQFTRPFAIEWAKELRDHCKKSGVAFFMKQLGRNPSRDGKIFRLKDSHGGNWDEWPDELKIREFPKAFHSYRKSEKIHPQKPGPMPKKKNSIKSATNGISDVVELKVYKPTKNEKAEFNRLNKIVRTGLESFDKAGEALTKIHSEKLWQAGGYDCWQDYCRSVLGMSRIHAHRLIKASQCMTEIREISDFELWPVSESQVRPLLRLESAEQRRIAWNEAVTRANQAQPTAEDVTEMVISILESGLDGSPQKKKPLTKSQQREKIISKLRRVVTKRKSWEEVEKLLEDLEKLF